eukprot:snap_masked-scaffold_41-processed-gene-2.75-mRNA-1 protein AED:0.32 eAED:0.32 QI:0/-1/0/1/-1/1/1/0/495
MTSVLQPPKLPAPGDIPMGSEQQSSNFSELKNLSKKELTNELQKQTDEAIEVAKKLSYEEAIANLLAAEKKARIFSQFPLVWTIISAVFKLVREQEPDNVEQFLFYVKFFFKKRAQSEKIQSQIISYCADEAIKEFSSDQDKEIAVLTVLRDLSSGKMTLEKIRASLTLKLSKIHMNKDNLPEANKILQTESPETYSTLDQRTKIEFLIEQLKVSILVKDFFRAKIISEKIDQDKITRWKDLKLEFHGVMIDLFMHEKEAFNLAHSSLEILKLYLMDEDKESLQVDLVNRVVIYLGAAEYSKDQVDLINYLTVKVLRNPEDELEEKLMRLVRKNLGLVKLLRNFVNEEIMGYPFADMKKLDFGGQLKEITAKKAAELQENDDNWIFLRFFQKVVEHDIKVVSTFYSRIKLDRVASMLLLEAKTVEEFVSKMVNEARLEAKIDRPNGIIRFGRKKSPDEILDKWSGDVSHLLQLVDKTCYLIEKENMLQQAGISFD